MQAMLRTPDGPAPPLGFDSRGGADRPAATGLRQKVGVLTFHRCINYGSYWQAHCLVEGLRERGHRAVLLDHLSGAAEWAELRCAMQPLLPVVSSRADSRLYAAKMRKFGSAVARLPLSSRFPLSEPGRMEPCDLILVGSDEVWNLAHPWYGGQAIFFGEGLPARRVASYAASFGNYDAVHGLERAWSERLKDFTAISVRDENSVELVSRVTGQRPALVLDPCLQFPPRLEAAEGEDEPYVAVYGHSFPTGFAEAAVSAARRRGWKLLSIGYRNDWADEQRLDAGPLDFSGLIGGAAAVVTNFFHGCVFALLYRKPFACVPSAYRLNKVRDLTSQLGAGAHLLAAESDHSQLQALLEQPPDPAIDRRIAYWRSRSNAYLDGLLG